MAPGGWTEDGVHLWLAEQSFPKGLRGSRGHDAAVLHGLDGTPVLCSDQCIEGVHFPPGTAPRAAGRKAVLRTLSDLAASACDPVAVTLNVRAPGATSEGSIRELILGAAEAAREHGAELVAGDLAMAEGDIGISVTAMGSLPADQTPVARELATPGQVVGVSGPLGGSFDGGRHLEPRPRFDAARTAVAAGATSMMDVSDGLAWDLYRLARAAGVRVTINLSSVPVHPDVDESLSGPGRLAHALHDGEDHELLACWHPSAPLPLGWTVIGEVLDGSGLYLAGGEGPGEWDPTLTGGWRHGENAPRPKGPKPKAPKPKANGR